MVTTTSASLGPRRTLLERNSVPEFLEQEAQAMLRRIDRVKPFVLQETMLPAAAPFPATLVAIERYLMADRRKLRAQVEGFVRWLRAEGERPTAPELQRRLTFLRLRFNAALTQLDLFSEAISQRSETDIGVWLSGLDVAAQDALQVPGYLDPPPILCYLHRGLGGAIRRAHTRLPGGGDNPAAIIRIPRERMIGFGIASSLVHEVGHQGAALLGLLPAIRAAIRAVGQAADEGGRRIWAMWERWISEIVADFWAVARVGITSTLGLISIVSLPRAFVFRINTEDPHPFPWLRVMVSCAVGDLLYPHPQWQQLLRLWRTLYPVDHLDATRRDLIHRLSASVTQLVRSIAEVRPSSLRGRSLADALVYDELAPERLSTIFEHWRARPDRLWSAPPTLVFAAFGRARITGRLSPDHEDQLLGKLITRWALASTLDIAAQSRLRAPAPVRLPSSLRPPRAARPALIA